MSLTTTEEAQTRALIAQQSAILSLASSEPTIISKLAATKVSLADLTAASVVNDTDLLLIRQGTTEKSAAKSIFIPDATTSVRGKVQLATSAESQAGTSSSIAVTPAGLASTNVGAILFTAGSSALPGTLKANGAAVSTTSYSALDAAIYCGDASNATALFGYRCTNSASPSGSRSITGGFVVLPDLRGEFLRGWDNGRGIDSGRVLGSWQKATLTVGDCDGEAANYNPAGLGTTVAGMSQVGADPVNMADYPNARMFYAAFAAQLTPSSGAGNYGGTVRTRNVALLACIKY